jgi:hypothetical protein
MSEPRPTRASPLDAGWCALPSVLTAPHAGELLGSFTERFTQGEPASSLRPAMPPGSPASGPSPVPVTTSSLFVRQVLNAEQLARLIAVLARGPALDWIRTVLHDSLALDLDRAWFRRQYAPARAPSFHRPHGWHQDGALGFDFLAQGEAPVADAVLPMITLWIALDACGVEAPGLELVTRRLHELLPPPHLADSCVRRQFPPDDFCRPALEPGDALVFAGDILHRTYVNPAMSRDRHSIEFRFFPSSRLPARLQGDCFVKVESGGSGSPAGEPGP